MVKKFFSFTLFSFLINSHFLYASHSTREDYERNRIIVRVWEPSQEVKEVVRAIVNEGSMGPFMQKGVGHVSLEVPSFASLGCDYISFWPGAKPPEIPPKEGLIPEKYREEYEDMKRLLALRRGSFHSKEDDYFAEGKRSSDKMVCLYTLDPEKFKETFLSFQRQVLADTTGETTGWSLVNSTMFVHSGSSQHSCASLALTLLRVADIRDLFLASAIPMKDKVSYFDDPVSQKVVKTTAIATMPHQVLDVVLKARLSERRHYPAIKSLPMWETSYEIGERKKAISERETLYEDPYDSSCLIS